MEPAPWRGDTTSGCNPARGVPTSAGSTFSSGENQAFEGRPAPLQHQDLTSRERHSNISHKYHITPAASSLHPLIPLLHYSSTHLPTSSLYSQLIRTPAAPPANAHSPTPICYHGNSVTSGRQLVKKPLNAFMLYMKEMRQQVLREGPQRESAAINRILGRRWHALSHLEQSKYYELAKKEQQLHMQLFPGWSAKDNYGKMKSKRSQQRGGSF